MKTVLDGACTHLIHDKLSPVEAKEEPKQVPVAEPTISLSQDAGSTGIDAACWSWVGSDSVLGSFINRLSAHDATRGPSHASPEYRTRRVVLYDTYLTP